jgi:hypothetical protein
METRPDHQLIREQDDASCERLAVQGTHFFGTADSLDAGTLRVRLGWAGRRYRHR